MAHANQPDLFATEAQPGLFDEQKSPVYRADPDKVRAHLHKILAEARTAQTLPWDERRVAYHQVVFPQMTRWLPEDEAAQLRLEFATEMARLKAA